MALGTDPEIQSPPSLSKAHVLAILLSHYRLIGPISKIKYRSSTPQMVARSAYQIPCRFRVFLPAILVEAELYVIIQSAILLPPYGTLALDPSNDSRNGELRIANK